MVSWRHRAHATRSSSCRHRGGCRSRRSNRWSGSRKRGATVLFQSMPEDVPGYGQLAERRARFHALLDTIAFMKEANIDRAQVGRGRMLRGDVLAMLPALPVVREAIADTGVGFVRRANPRWPRLFLCQSHRGDRSSDG